MAIWDEHLPPHISNYKSVPCELQPAVRDLLSPEEYSFLSSNQVITGPQLHSLAAQIVTMRCIRRSLKVAQVLEAKPEWKAACASVLPLLGPLALLHEPLHELPTTVLKIRKKRSRSGTPGEPKKLRKRETRPPIANPAGRVGRPRKDARSVHKPTSKPRRAKTKNAKGACQAAADQDGADSDASCGVPFPVPVDAWLEGPTAGDLDRRFGKVAPPGTINLHAKGIQGKAKKRKMDAKKVSTAAEGPLAGDLGGRLGELATPGTIDVRAEGAQGRGKLPKLVVEKVSSPAAERPGGIVKQAGGDPEAAAKSVRVVEKATCAAEEPEKQAECGIETAEDCAQERELVADEPMHGSDKNGCQQGGRSGRMQGFSEEEEEAEKADEEELLPQLPALKAIRMPAVAEDDNYCSVCGDEDEDDPENVVLMCEGPGCQVVVHQQCYGVTKVPKGAWICDGCAAGIPPSASVCLLCPCSGGALRRITHCSRVRLPPSPSAVSAADALRTLAGEAEAGKEDPVESHPPGHSDHSSASTATAERVSGPSGKLGSQVVWRKTNAAEVLKKPSSQIVWQMFAQYSAEKVSSSTPAPPHARGGQHQAPVQALPSPQPAKTTLTELADLANLAQPHLTKSASKKHALSPTTPRATKSASEKHALSPTAPHAPVKRRKSSTQGPWVHSACALWAPSVTFEDVEALEGVNLEGLTQKQINVSCTFCKQGGSAVRCSFSKCPSTFHVLCARHAGCLLPISDSGDTLAFCGIHSHDGYTAQREEMICNDWV